MRDIDKLNTDESRIRREYSEMERNMAYLKHDLKEVQVNYIYKSFEIYLIES